MEKKENTKSFISNKKKKELTEEQKKMRLIVSKQQDGNLKPNHMYNHTKVKSKLAITKLAVLRNFALIKNY